MRVRIRTHNEIGTMDSINSDQPYYQWISRMSNHTNKIVDVVDTDTIDAEKFYEVDLNGGWVGGWYFREDWVEVINS